MNFCFKIEGIIRRDDFDNISAHFLTIFKVLISAQIRPEFERGGFLSTSEMSYKTDGTSAVKIVILCTFCDVLWQEKKVKIAIKKGI